jgi:hypothetical protein
MFPRIISLLRTGRLDQSGLTKEQKFRLVEELDYYQISLSDAPSLVPPVTKSSSFSWDSQKKGSNIELSNNNTIVTKFGANDWNSSTILGSESVTSYKVKVLNGGDGGFMIGLAPNTINSYASSNHMKCGWYLFGINGKLWSQGDCGCAYTGAINLNDIIEVYYHKENGTISFSINGQDKGTAYHLPKHLDLYPCLEIRSPGCTMEITQ